MTIGRSFRFSRAITRRPCASVVDGLRDNGGPDPDFALFEHQHADYCSALGDAGVEVLQLPEAEAFADSVFVEDTAICIGGVAIVLRPGAPSRLGEAALIRPALEQSFSRVVGLPGKGFVDGGDVLVSDDEVFIGLSARTNIEGFESLAAIAADLGYMPVKVETPETILHFKTECGLLDSNIVFATRALAATGCFKNYRVIEVPPSEEAAANIVRINEVVLISAGYPESAALLRENGYSVIELNTSEAAKIDGGLSCMSLRF